MKNIILIFLIIVLFNKAISKTGINLNYNKSNLQQEEFFSPDGTKFERISSGYELNSGNKISFIVQDDEGFMWFASSVGVVRYDGYNTTTFFGSSSERPEIINCICKDDEGLLWLAPNNTYIYKFDNKYQNYIQVELNNDVNAPFCNQIRTIIDDDNGNLIIGANGGLKILNKKDGTIKHYYSTLDSAKNLSSNDITSLCLDRNGLIYIGTTDKGLFVFDRTSETFTNYQHILSDKKSLSNNNVRCIYEDKNSNIWIGTDYGLNFFDKQNNNFNIYKNDPDNSNSISHNRITAICEDKNNEFWIGTLGGGLNNLKEDGTFTRFNIRTKITSSIANDFVKKLYVDNSNVLWIGSWGDGVYKLDLERKKFHSISNFFEYSKFEANNNVSSVFIDSYGIVWISTESSSGIYEFTKNKFGLLNFREYRVVSNSTIGISSCIEDKNSNLWFCSVSGKLFEYNRKEKSFNLFERNGIIEIHYLDENNILIISNSGYLKFDINSKKFCSLNSKLKISDSLANDNSGTAFNVKENNIWFSFLSGIFCKYEIDKDSITFFKNIYKIDTSVYLGGVRSICQDRKGNLWFGTERALISMDTSTSNFKINFKVRAHAILEDDNGFIWTASDGLYKYDPENETEQTFDVSDGLHGNEFVTPAASFKDQKGTLYFGGTNGLTYFNPSEIKNNPYIPNITLTDFKILNESVKPSPENPFLKINITTAKDITLSYKENVFSFEFAALIYNNPSKNQYAYMMEGFDKDWVYCGTRRNVTYTNLDPGEYTFRVKGSNNDGIWNEEGISIKITITPPWWQTWWFKSCGASFILLSVGFGYKKRMSKLKKEKEVQEEYSRKLLASQEEERKRIANELHDSIAHDILILKNDVVSAMNATKEEKTKNALNRISDQSTETLNEVRNISYNLHPHQIEALGITKAIRSIIDKSSGSSKVNFIHDIENIDKIFTEENEVHIFRIVQEAISNIIKYSDSPEAIIKITCTKKSITILISDIGKGFDIENVEKGSLGLSGISERVKILGGTLSIESKRGEGTVMKILIPVIIKNS